MYKFFFLILGIMFFSQGCQDDKEDIMRPDEKFLYQTIWEGKIINPDETEINIKVEFITADEGSYYFLESSHKHSLDYEFKDKILTIYGGHNNILFGEWWIKKSTEKVLELERFENYGSKSSLILNKIF